MLQSSRTRTGIALLATIVLSAAVASIVLFTGNGNTKSSTSNANAESSGKNGEIQSAPTPIEWEQVGNNITWEDVGASEDKTLSLSRDGTTVAIGQFETLFNSQSSGQVDIRRYDETTGSWLPLGIIESDLPMGRFGYSVSLNGNGTVVAIGDDDDGTSSTGRVMVYKLQNNVWTQLGQTIDGGDDPDLFAGRAVSLSADGSVLAVHVQNTARQPGPPNFVRVYRLNGDSWEQFGQAVFGEQSTVTDAFSLVLSEDGTTFAISSLIPGFGYAKVYRLNGDYNNWDLQGETLEPKENESIGVTVSLSGDGTRVAVGVQVWQSSNLVRVYEFSGDGWNQVGDDIDTQGTVGARRMSLSMSTDGNVVAIGPQDDTPYSKVYAYNNGWSQVGSDIDSYSLSPVGYQLPSVSLSGSGDRVAVFGLSGEKVQVHDISNKGDRRQMWGWPLLFNP